MKMIIAAALIALSIAFAGYSIRQAKLAEVPQVKRVLIKKTAFEVFYNVRTFPNGACSWSLDNDANVEYGFRHQQVRAAFGQAHCGLKIRGTQFFKGDIAKIRTVYIR